MRAIGERSSDAQRVAEARDVGWANKLVRASNERIVAHARSEASDGVRRHIAQLGELLHRGQVLFPSQLCRARELDRPINGFRRARPRFESGNRAVPRSFSRVHCRVLELDLLIRKELVKVRDGDEREEGDDDGDAHRGARDPIAAQHVPAHATEGGEEALEAHPCGGEESCP